jgi:poly(3-hydroxybutyrate) depolymerase
MQRLNKATAWSAALLLLASLPVGTAPKSSPRALALRIGAMQRSYVEYVPLRLETPTAAVVIVLHGLGGNGEQVIEQGHWTSEADANGFIVFVLGRNLP